MILFRLIDDGGSGTVLGITAEINGNEFIPITTEGATLCTHNTTSYYNLSNLQIEDNVLYGEYTSSSMQLEYLEIPAIAGPIFS